ncbi:hypothetical protein MCUN1_002511 [Malassezia cuniculi]|uniref:WD repeat-containing protein 70 n=1 Tax=Malassezia cuniculi TaxID=948313 RepID=A0AAF0J6X3_9BASI|nr:hypothetical protein MCUN1_002511 [Malassezia cuniculi]
MDDDALRAMLPMGFGKAAARAAQKPKPHAADNTAKRRAVSDENDERDAKRSETDAPVAGPSVSFKEPTVPHRRNSADKSAEGSEPRAAGNTAAFGGMPLDKHVSLSDHKRAISALCLDRSGARVATGSLDYKVKLWDFGGMTSAYKPFKTFEPAENYPVVQLEFSPHSDVLLCLTASKHARLFSREGDEISVFRKGDVFLRDMRHTTGHVTDITCGGWNPTKPGWFMTGGTDSTIRLWDAEQTDKQKTVIVLRSKERGSKTHVSAAKYTPDGRMLIAAGTDGTLCAWSTSGSYSRPAMDVGKAHVSGTTTSSIACRDDGRTFVTRGGDDTVKLWDLRQTKSAVHSIGGIPTTDEYTDIIFSPDGQSVLTGVAAVPGGSDDGADLGSAWGQIAMLDATDLSVKHVHPVDKSGVCRLVWHARLNQILASTRSGAVKVFYDDEASQLGALLGVNKRARTGSNPFFIELLPGGISKDTPIIVPQDDDDEEYYEGKVDRWANWVHDPRNARLPEKPIYGSGRQGRVMQSDIQSMIDTVWQDSIRDEDPREALLKYAEKAEKDPQWTKVYAKTQPKPIFAKEREPDVEEPVQAQYIKQQQQRQRQQQQQQHQKK